MPFLLFALLVLLSAPAHAEESEARKAFRAANGVRASVWSMNDKTDPIAKKLSECINGNLDTHGICCHEAYVAYEKLLNDLLAGGRHSENQKTWLIYQKNSEEIIKEMGRENQGTIWGLISGLQRVSMIRQRIADLAFFMGGGNE